MNESLTLYFTLLIHYYLLCCTCMVVARDGTRSRRSSMYRSRTNATHHSLLHQLVVMVGAQGWKWCQPRRATSLWTSTWRFDWFDSSHLGKIVCVIRWWMWYARSIELTVSMRGLTHTNYYYGNLVRYHSCSRGPLSSKMAGVALRISIIVSSFPSSGRCHVWDSWKQVYRELKWRILLLYEPVQISGRHPFVVCVVRRRGWRRHAVQCPSIS